MFQDERNRYRQHPSFENRGDGLSISSISSLFRIHVDIIFCTELDKSLRLKKKLDVPAGHLYERVILEFHTMAKVS